MGHGRKDMANKNLQDIIKYIQKEVKDSDIGLASEDRFIINRISTEIPLLDSLLGGGLPFGRTTEIFGDFSAGKTFLAQMMIKAAQNQGYTCGYVDVEKTFEPKWFRNSGCDLDRLLLSQPAIGEEALDTVIKLIKAKVNIVVLDSIAALMPATADEEGMDHKFIGVQARLYNDGIKRITSANKHNESIFIALNQTRVGIGGYFPTEALPAGKGQYFFSHIMLKVSRGPAITDDADKKKKIGFRMKLFVEKNKTAGTMFQSAEFPFLFSGVIDTYSGLVELALDSGVIIQNGPYYSYEGQKYLGKNNLLEFLKKDDTEYDKLKKKIEGEKGG